jgi:YidC/Oxa1 family membrane protein insertase
MDVKRLLLLIPLAVLAYLIVVQWNQDYGQVATAPQAPAISSESQTSTSSASDDADGGDLSVPTQNRAPDGIADEQATSGNSRDLVAVSTDVLDVRIDPQGGDIVYAALPQHQYALDSGQPFVLLSNDQTRSYMARSGLQLEGHQGRLTFASEQTEYRLAEGEDALQVDLSAKVSGVDVIKRFTFDRDSYAVSVDYLLDNQGETPVTARFVGQLVRDSSDDPSSGPKMGMRSFLGAAYSPPEDNSLKVDFEDIGEGKFDNRDAEGGWVAMIQHYFTSAWAPPQDQQNLYYATTDSQGRNVAAFAGATENVAAGSAATLGATLYMGP